MILMRQFIFTDSPCSASKSGALSAKTEYSRLARIEPESPLLRVVSSTVQQCLQIISRCCSDENIVCEQNGRDIATSERHTRVVLVAFDGKSVDKNGKERRR